jgi:glutathione S-transferase
MAWINLVTLLALIEYFTFGWLVGTARRRYGIKAPATSGDPVFERYFRVQQNTLEVLVIFLPALWISAQYWDPLIIAAIGAIFLVGRVLYFNTYVRNPASRGVGFGLSMGPALLLVLAGLVGIARTLLHG